MSGRPLLRLRATARPPAATPMLIAPCFRRGVDGARGEAVQSRPTLLSLEGVGFVDDLLAGLAALGPGRGWPQTWPVLRPLRDWCEPPVPYSQHGLLFSLGRAEPGPGELVGGRPLSEALAAHEAGGGRWIRKLYLPYHQRFTAVLVEAVCDAPGLPPLDRARVAEQGLVLRRLVPDPARERWQDWVGGPERGVWAEIADAELRGAGAPLDPRAPALSPLMRAALTRRLGLPDDAPLRVTTTPLTPLPPASAPGRRTTSFGVPRLFSSEQEAPALPVADAHALSAEVADALRASLGLDGLPEGAPLWPELRIADPGAYVAALRQARVALLARLGVDGAGSAAELGADLAARLGAEAARAEGAEPPWPAPVQDAAWHNHLSLHLDGEALERRLAEIEAAIGAAGAFAWDRLTQRDDPEDGEQDPLIGRLLRLPGPTAREGLAFVARVAAGVLASGGADPAPPRSRLDPEHVYAIWCYFVLRPPKGCCEPERVIWSRRTEPFCLAEPMDLLGLRPVQLRLPDLARMARDLPRLPAAGASPMAVVLTPPDSGVSTGDEAADTARAWGVAWICSIGIPVLSFCAWALFSFIFNILIALPGFTWMLLLKVCVPAPVPKKEAA